MNTFDFCKLLNNFPFDPNILSKKLNTYAKDKNYIRTIISIIRFNKLTEYDDLTTTATISEFILVIKLMAKPTPVIIFIFGSTV